tara:strand:- start:942 stop:1193 length:252 start_codon:yes stop_codon:yes gene_type:complete
MKKNSPELNLLKTYSDNSYVDIIEKKYKEIENMFNAHMEVLEQISIKREKLNKDEETVQYELSGLHGAKTVLEQLIEEAKIQD